MIAFLIPAQNISFRHKIRLKFLQIYVIIKNKLKKEHNMSKFKITDVRANPGDSAFLVDNGKTAVMYDSGFAFTGEKVAENIKAILGGRSLDYIFLTHSHYDHVMGAPHALKIWPNAKVVAGEYAAKIFAKPTAKALMRSLDEKFAKKCGIEEPEDLTDFLNADITVKDGDTISLKNTRFTAIDLPGHTRCSVGFWCEEEKLLLSTETLGVYNGKDDVVPSYLVGYEMTLKSIEKARILNIENILVPHYGVLGREETKFYLEKAEISARETASQISEMLKSGVSKEQITLFFKNKYYHGYIKEIYPIDAMLLNTGIMVDLIEKECVKR